MRVGWWRLKTGLLGVAMAVISGMTLTEMVAAQDRAELYQNDWNVAVEQDNLAIKKGCIDPDQKEFLINYTIMAAEGVHAYVGGSDLSTNPWGNPDENEGNSLIAQLRTLPACSRLLTYNFPVYIPITGPPGGGLRYSLDGNGALLGIPMFPLGSWPHPNTILSLGSDLPVYDYWTHYYYDEWYDDEGADEYRHNRITGTVEIYDDDDDEWYPSTGVIFLPPLRLVGWGLSDDFFGRPPSWITIVRFSYPASGWMTYEARDHLSQTTNSNSNNENVVPIIPFSGLIGIPPNFSNIPVLTTDDAGQDGQPDRPASATGLKGEPTGDGKPTVRRDKLPTEKTPSKGRAERQNLEGAKPATGLNSESKSVAGAKSAKQGKTKAKEDNVEVHIEFGTRSRPERGGFGGGGFGGGGGGGGFGR